LKESIEILQLFESALQSGSKMIMATVVDVRGSAYRRAGAHFLLVSDGRKAGSISAGCLENDLLARGDEVFDLTNSLLLEYDSDEFFGLNYGCDGTIQILVHPVSDSQTSFPRAFERAQKLGQTLVLATVYQCEDDSLIGSQVLFNQKEIFAGTASSAITNAVEENSRTILDSKINCNLQISSGTRVFCEVIKPSLRLAIFGAGDDVEPLLSIARSIGLEPHLIDSRRSYLDRFRETEIVHQFESESNVSEILSSPEHTAIVIMSHNFELDKRFLTTVLESDCEYIGVMGSRKRTLKMLKELGRPQDSRRIKFPIGLDLGAETPEEIALSICSEILAFFRNTSGRPLSTMSGTIHHRVDDDHHEENKQFLQQNRQPICATGDLYE
jgi:Xanthine and CO dehydrogenases maturation factor, XdhC/CoxF family